MAALPSRIGAASRSWMAEYGLQRSFFKQDICPCCQEARRRKYVRHPFPLPRPYGKGQWLLSDCACVKEERLRSRQAREQIMVSKKVHPLPRGLRQHSFANFKVSEFNRKPYDDCRAFVRNFGKAGEGKGILLYGRTGRGKTHLAAAMANSLQDKYSVAFAYVPVFLEGMRGTSAPLQSFLSADLLILDDIGSERETEWAVERLLMIVDGRLLNLKPTVFTTNFNIEDFEVRVGAKLSSRILGNNIALLLQGPDWRLIAKDG